MLLWRESSLLPSSSLAQFDSFVLFIYVRITQVEAYLDVIDKHLEGRSFLAGDKFTLADLTHVPFTELIPAASKADIIDSRPHVKAWWERVTSRQAVKQLQEKFPYQLS